MSVYTAPIQPIKTNFTAGELSPRLYGRVDIAKYVNGAAILENFVPLPHGGIQSRPGTRYVQEVKDSSAKTRIIPFEFNEDQSYILELGDQYIRFYTDDAVLTETAQNITGATQANPGVITIASHPFSNGDWIFIESIAGMTELNNKWYIVAGATTNTFTLTDIDGNAINTTSFTAYSSGGTAKRAYEISSPWSTSDLFDLRFAQSADVMYIVHPSYAPRKLTRSGATSWALSTPTFTGTVGGGFNASGEYPIAVTFHEERLVFGGSTDQPQTIFMSQAGDFENFDPGTGLDTEAVEYTISTDKVNQIQWLSSGRVLACGTVGGEFIITSNDNNDAITPTNVRITRQTTYGSAALRPIRISNSVLFIQRAKRKMREFFYDFQSDGYIAQDVTILSEHILRELAGDLAYQQEPQSLVWIVRADGQLATLTYQKEQDVFAWSRHIVGGSFGSGDAVVESVAVIPDDVQDQVWITVKRTINGVTRRYVEYFTEAFYETSDVTKADAKQMDSSLTYSGSATGTVTGLDHLEGESVVILADGNVKTAQTVASGSITLPNSETATKIQVGLSYIPKVRTLTFEAGGFKGTAQGKIARVSAVSFRFFQTLGGYAGHGDASDLMEIPFNDDGVTMDESPDLFSGYKRVQFDHGFTREPHVQFEQRQPLPVTILSIMPEMDVNA